MKILEFIFIIFIITIPPTIAVLFVYDKKDITEKFKKASECISKHIN